MKLIDISMALHENMPVYPRNTPFVAMRVQSIPRDRSNNSELSLGTHTGTHADAPRHVSNRGIGVDALPLASFYGPCTVLDLTHCEKIITAADLRQHTIRRGSIILLKTKNSLRRQHGFNPHFISVAPDAADYLVKKKIKTVGIDALSIKQPGTPNGPVHTKLITHMTVFEGLVLRDVAPGDYIFCGLPLRIKGGDGAPARAILIKP